MIAMRTWDIARALLGTCDSSDDVDMVLLALDDPAEFRKLYSMLLPFSSDSGNSLSQNSSFSSGTGDPSLTTSPNGETQHKLPTALPESAKNNAARQLEKLFRSNGMTNKQVEEWLVANFEISRSVGKGSLRNFLEKVFGDLNLAKVNQIIASAQGPAGCT